MPLSALLRSAQDAPAPDFIVRPAIAAMVAGARKGLQETPDADARLPREMAGRVIAEHVEAAKRRYSVLDQRSAVRGVANIRTLPGYTPTGGFYGMSAIAQIGFRTRGDHHCSACTGKCFRDCASDTATGAGYDRDATANIGAFTSVAPRRRRDRREA